ncbi:MAG: alpha/beta hydrolase [Acidobacteria bacterium]|nr:alpha/beta hydrolase [Acidobacteriota bacterium]
MTSIEPRELAGPAGRLDLKIDLPPDAPCAVAVIAHPHTQYGGTLQTRPVAYVARALTTIGVAAVRFNFRGAGTSAGTFDEGRGEQDDFRAVVDYAAARWPGLPIWAVGLSFGSWVALTAGATDPRVTQLVAIAPPVDRYDYAAAIAADKPVVIIHGEADELIPVKLVRRFYGQLPEPRELLVIEDADHMFDGKVSTLAEAVADVLGD